MHICDPILENQPYRGNCNELMKMKNLYFGETLYHINNFCNEIPFI